MDPFAAFLGIVLIIGVVIAIAAHVVRQEHSAPRVSATTRLVNAPTTGHDPRKKTMFYRTRDGREDYQFSFEQQRDGTWRAYIESQPNYGGRDSDAHTTHRLSDGSRKYVCWTDPLDTLAQAKQVAAMWSDATQEYIRTGKRF
jgi:broad specificity polyphosphatase/5'/3'-nucleotidase SurE